jgi:hypothetical protein
MNIHNSSLDKLALYGGHPVRTKPWPTYDKGNVILDDDDVSMVIDVIRSKRLYRYDNRPLHETKVGQFEIELKEYFQVQYS